MRAVTRVVGGALGAARERWWVREAVAAASVVRVSGCLAASDPGVWVAHLMATEQDHPSAAPTERAELSSYSQVWVL
jgi:hypothetical protein